MYVGIDEMILFKAFNPMIGESNRLTIADLEWNLNVVLKKPCFNDLSHKTYPMRFKLSRYRITSYKNVGHTKYKHPFRTQTLPPHNCTSVVLHKYTKKCQLPNYRGRRKDLSISPAFLLQKSRVGYSNRVIH